MIFMEAEKVKKHVYLITQEITFCLMALTVPDKSLTNPVPS